MAYFWSQFRQVLRRLGRSPVFAATALITLALGIGANTAIFGVIDGVLLKPLPYPHPERLVGLWHRASGLNNDLWDMSRANYFIYREQSRAFQDVGLYNAEDSVSVTGAGQPEQVRAIDVTDGVLPILGVPPMLGRWFNRQDDSPGSPQTAILSYSYWRQKLGSRPDVIGRTVTVDGRPRQIVGVMPQEFHFLDHEDPALFLPFQADRNQTFIGGFHFDGLARLKPGVTLAEANSDVRRMLPIVLRSFPPPPGRSVDLFEKLRLVPAVHLLKEDVVGDIGHLLWILMGGIGIVLLIACANVANLLLVRAEGRQQELAVRAALGAGRIRLAGELLFDGILVGLLGGGIGLVLASGFLRFLIILAPPGLPRLHEIGINLSVLLFAVSVALLAGALSGLIPTLKYTGGRAPAGLREGGRILSEGRERHRARNALVVLQVSLAFVLLICSGLMIRSFRALIHVNPGFSSPATVQTFRLLMPETEVSNPESVVRLQQAMEEKIGTIPGVSSVALTNGAPMDGTSWNDPVFVKDRNYADGEARPTRRYKFASPGLFRALGVPLIAGRDFTWTETYQKLPVAIVSENFAREYWGDPKNALGKEVRTTLKDSWREVVGVVGDVHEDGIREQPPETVYWPIMTSAFEGDPDVEVRRELVFVARTPRAGSISLIKDISNSVWSLDASLPLYDIHTLQYFYTRSMARTSFTLVMLGIAGAVGLLLGVVGLYSVVAYSVLQRVREIGIRMALGAERRELVRAFVCEGLLLTAVGTSVGFFAAMATTKLLSSLLFNVGHSDPMTYCAVTAGLIATSILASCIPARRAAKVDPMVALRCE
jgi:predicted permease